MVDRRLKRTLQHAPGGEAGIVIRAVLDMHTYVADAGDGRLQATIPSNGLRGQFASRTFLGQARDWVYDSWLTG
ncbi:hypothetical protein BN2475_170030 [Paraburkholderia ribeironis]|uniref:Uncharacterized protein n=1 Tax=Paraburkholderia ribeironis TaxID=1247936 RepID=A0A1N7RUF9_9BURK|nr:hypothetical protein BN2475_170030 [Paraburkholderia ribeironis]